MQNVTVTFEATGNSKQYPAKQVAKLHDYHGAQVGKFTDRQRTAFLVPAPSSDLDFEYMLGKLR